MRMPGVLIPVTYRKSSGETETSDLHFRGGHMPSKIIGKEQLYIEYADKVMGYIRSKITNQADAEDLHSTVFLKVYQKFDTFDQTKASVSTWIYTITKNTVTDFFRTRHVHSEIEEDILDEGDEYQGILDEETLNELADAMEKLPERERDLIILHYYTGLTLKEVAVKMGMSYSNTKLVHNKALMLLRNRMDID